MNAIERSRTLSTIFCTYDFDVEIPDHLHHLMNEWEDELLGSSSMFKKMVLHKRNLWVVNNLISRILLLLTGY